MRRGQQEPVGRQRDRAAGAGRHLTAPAAAHHAQVGDRRREPLGDVDDDPRVGVERLGLAPLGARARVVRASVALIQARPRPCARRCRARSSARACRPRPARRRAPRTAASTRVEVAVPPAPTIRSPRSSPARSAALPASTARTSTPSRSGRPTARRSRRATRGGAIATPSRARLRRARRGRAPRRARATDVSAGSARIRPASTRTALIPSRRPSTSISGPPDDPRGSGAVCSIAPADPAPARAPEAARGRGHEPGRDAQAAAAGVGEREHRAPDRHCASVVGPLDRLDLARVDLDHGEVEVLIGAEHAAALRAAVGERDRHLVVAKVVGVGQDPARRDHEAGAPTPAAAEPDHRRAGRARRRPGSRTSIPQEQSCALLHPWDTPAICVTSRPRTCRSMYATWSDCRVIAVRDASRPPRCQLLQFASQATP